MRWALIKAVLLSALFLTVTCPAYAIPHSTRSERAIARVKPELTRMLDEAGLRYGAPVFIRIFKEPGELELWMEREGKFVRFKRYPICYFSGELGPKLRVGDHQSPEGFYSVSPEQLNPVSSYHLSFNLGYPNAFDRAHRRTGSALMVHGSCVSIGCYAMGDPAIEEIYALMEAAFRNGQRAIPVHAFPFVLTQEGVERRRDSPWYPFWLQLKEGYDYFERNRFPPRVSVRDRRYVVE